MEQHPVIGGDPEAVPQLVEPPGRLTDEQLIRYHITEALREDRPIDHATVRAIASQLHGGQASPLYALASSGALVDGLRAELDTWRYETDTGPEVEPWLDAMDEYLQERGDPGPVEGWADLWPIPPPSPEATEDQDLAHTLARAAGQLGATVAPEQLEDDESEVRADLMARITVAGVTTLGQVATVTGGGVEHPTTRWP
jgi:hypothetical protein